MAVLTDNEALNKIVDLLKDLKKMEKSKSDYKDVVLSNE